MKIQEVFKNQFHNNILRKPIIINTPGFYTLSDNIEIEFDPPYPSYEEIQELPSLRYGYFAGIIIVGENITINMKGFMIKMSSKYALQQRFFSIFELTNSPFPFQDGLPLSITKEKWKASSNVTIKNGNIGRSSHTGIHGNNNTNINLYSLNIFDFEVGGIMMNGAMDLNIHCCDIGPNFQNLWVNAKLSGAQQLLHFFENVIPQKILPSQNVLHLQKEVQKAVLATSLDDVPITFKNEKLVCDGTVYGISLHKSGVAIGGHSIPNQNNTNDNLSKSCVIQNITIHDLKGDVDEKTAYVTKENEKLLRDVAGQIIDLEHLIKTREIVPLVKVQMESAQWLYEYPNVKTTFFAPNEIIEWCLNDGNDIDTLRDLMETLLKPKMGRDIMIHVNKGVIGLRLDSLQCVNLQNIKLDTIQNIASHTIENTEYLISAMVEDSLKDYTGNDTLAISCSNVNHGEFEKIKIENVLSKAGTVYGMLIMNGTKHICSKNNTINLSEKNNKNCGILIQDSCKDISISLS